MNPQDLKKLIAGFLVFSAIASAVTLISINFVGTTNPQQQAFQAEGENPLSTISKNAFVEKLPSSGQQAAGSGNIQSAYVTNTNSSNLTRNMAGIFAGQMIANNPSGPNIDQNGDPTVVNLPGEDKTAEMIKQALSKTAFTFDDKTSVPANKIAKMFSTDDVSSYLKQVYETLGRVSSSTKLSATVNQTPTPEELALSALGIEAAFQKLSSLSVPKPFVETHTALLRFFANQKNVFNAVADYQTDPMKAMLALQNEKEIIARDLALVKNAAMRVDTKIISSGNIPEWQNFYSEIFGVKKAYAGWFDAGYGTDAILVAIFGEGVANIGQWISSRIEKIAEWLYTTALRIAVNIMINEFQNQVVNWIAGNGQPKFITDWSGFLKGVADKAIGQVIYDMVPQLCSGLGPLLRANLLPVPYAHTGVRCTLTQIFNNVNRFFDRFQNGSWVAYSYAMQPQYNYYGNIILVNDQIWIAAANAEKAASNQAVASKGFLSITTSTGRCLSSSPNEEGVETCDRYEQKTITPGAVVGETLTTSLGWKGNQIVSAQRFEDLVAAIVNASINRIIVTGLSSLTEFTNQATYQPRNIPSSNLNPSSFTGAAPYGLSDPGSIGSTVTSVNNFIGSLNQAGVFQQNKTIIDSDTGWLSLALSTTSQQQATTSAITALNQLSSSCSFMSSQISARIADINSMAATVRRELSDANTLNNLGTAALTASTTQDISAIVSQFQTINITQIANTATTAQQRLASLTYFISVVQQNVNECSGGTLPAIDAIPPPPSSD